MKNIVYVLAFIALVASTGCVLREDHRGGDRDWYERHHEHGDHWEHY